MRAIAVPWSPETQNLKILKRFITPLLAEVITGVAVPIGMAVVKNTLILAFKLSVPADPPVQLPVGLVGQPVAFVIEIKEEAQGVVCANIVDVSAMSKKESKTFFMLASLKLINRLSDNP